MRRPNLLAVPFVPLLALSVVSVGTDAPIAPADSGAQQALECLLIGADMEQATARPSPLRQVEFSYDGGEGLLCHGAPSARGREIMGGLVPFGEPWRMGANEPTTIHLSAAASIGGVDVEAGSYSIYGIPGEGEWEIFVNSNYERWGIPINAEVRGTEIGSFTVTPGATDSPVETLTYSYEDGNIVLEWENTRLSFPVG
jgi:hypothetical protein